MDILGWLVVAALFALGMAGAIFPVLPGALAIYAAFFAYGWFFSFEPFGFWFWCFQTVIVIVLIVSDYIVNAWGVKKFEGSRASVIGSTIGIIAGPFVIPAFGLIIGPFAGAVIGELLVGSNWKRSLLVGWGALIGFFSSMVVKLILQIAMIVIFVLWLVF